MARLERDDSKATKADLDALIELEEKLESKLPPGATVICHLRDPSIRDHDLYVIHRDVDSKYRPKYLVDETHDLGKHSSEQQAIVRCQEHHDSQLDMGGRLRHDCLIKTPVQPELAERKAIDVTGFNAISARSS
jgi:hypothetical protein